MRLIKLLCIPVLLLTFVGCSRVLYDGKVLNGKSEVDLSVTNASDHTVYVEALTADYQLIHDFKMVKAGEHKSIAKDTGDWDVIFRVRHRQAGPDDFIGDVLKEFEFERGAFEDLNLEITNLTLLGSSRQKGFFKHSGDPVIVTLEDGRVFTLKRGSSPLFYTHSGVLHFTIEPLHDPYNLYGPVDDDWEIDNQLGHVEYYPPDGGPAEWVDFSIPTKAHYPRTGR